MRIELRGVSKAFGKKTVIEPVSLTFASRAFTTLLRMIAGLETPDTGEIALGDTLVFSKDKGIDLPPEKRGLGGTGERELPRRHLHPRPGEVRRVQGLPRGLRDGAGQRAGNHRQLGGERLDCARCE